MRSIPSVVREKDPHEDREERSGDYAKQRAGRASQPRGCDEQPNEAGQCYANFPRHYWRAPLDPRQPKGQRRLLAKWGEYLAASARWLDQVRPDAARPTPTERRPPIPRRARLALVSHPVVAQTTGPEAKPNEPASQAAEAAPALPQWQMAPTHPTDPAR